MADVWKQAGLTARESTLMEATLAAVADEMKRQNSRIAALEERLAKIEKSKAISYRGVFAPAEKYDAGDFVTHGGSLWCCLRDTYDMPGRSASWRLAAKG